MDIKIPYLDAMRERAPKMFLELCRAKEIDAHASAVSKEGHRILDEILASEPRTPDGRVINERAEREAEEQVLAMMLEFPEENETTT